MSLLLHIDTATEIATLCLSDNDLIIESLTNTQQKDHASFLQSSIKKLLEHTGYKIGQLNAVSVTVGPGSYTGLRVGIASAKGICYALKIPIITLNTLEVMAHSSITVTKNMMNNLLFTPMIDARRSDVFTATYDNTLNEILPASVMSLNDESFRDMLDAHTVVFSGSGSQKCSTIINHKNAVFQDVKIMPDSLAIFASQKFERADFANIITVDAIYLKEFYS